MIVPKVVYKTGTPLQHAWARWFNYQTMSKNSNNLVSVVGKTGSGKTWSAISIAEIMSGMSGVPFGIENIVFSLRELMELINSDKLRKGSVIVFDEPQISISAREFQSEANKVFNYLLSTFRHRNFSLFFCTPFENLLDKSTRKLFHVRIETAGVNIKDKTCKLKALYVEHVDYREEPYRKRLMAIFPKESGGFQTKKIDFWDVPKPNQALIDLYEAKKREFTDNLNKNILDRLIKYEDKGKSMTTKHGGTQVLPEEDIIHFAPTLREKVVECLKKGMRKQKDIAKELGIDPRMVNYHYKSIKNEQKSIELRKNTENRAKMLQNAVG